MVRWDDIPEKPLERISLGLLDDVLCGGAVKSDTILIAGGPGAGKSHLMLEICRVVESCLYIPTEEDIPTIKARGVRMKVSGKGIAFLNAMGGDADLPGALVEMKPACYIVDSLNGFSGGELGNELRVLEVLKKLSVQLQCPGIIISQVNADLDFEGVMRKRHAVDVLLRLNNSEIKADSGEYFRILESSDKNRNGRVGIETWLEMTETGLVETEPRE